MDRNEKQNSFRNTRRSRGESKSIKKLKRRLRVTTVFAVVMMAAFLGSLAWMKISNDASQRKMDELKRDIANKDEEISRLGGEKQDSEKKGAEPTDALTPEPTDALTPEPTAALTPEPTATLTPEPTDALTPEPTDALMPEPTAALTPEPTAAPTPEPTAAPTPEPTVTPTPEPTATSTPEQTVTPTPEPQDTPVAEPATGTMGGDAEEKSTDSEPDLHAMEAFLDHVGARRYQFAFEKFTQDNLGEKPVSVTSGTHENNVLEDVTSDYLQNLILLAAYEKRLMEIERASFDDDTYNDAFVKDDSPEDFKLVLTILQRVDTNGKDIFSKEHSVDPKTTLIGRIGYSKKLEEAQGDISEYLDTTAATYLPEGYKYIQDFLMNPAYFGDEACMDISEAKQYFGSDTGSFSIEKGMSLLKHLTLGHNQQENKLWNYNNGIFLLDDRLAAKNIDEKPVGNLIRKKMDIEGSEDGVSYPFYWIEDTGQNEDGTVHSYVYLMFPCNDGNHWCVSALFIDGVQLSEDQAGKYCNYLLEMAESPAPVQGTP